MKEQPLDDEGLTTLICEVESVVNGRPITKSSDSEALNVVTVRPETFSWRFLERGLLFT